MELYFRKLGSGKPIIILHGLFGSSDNWYSIGKALSENHTVYLVDLRNHGNSPHSDVHDYPSMVSDIKEFMDVHSIRKSIIIGHSMGGKVAMFLSVEFPSLIHKLIVIDISPKQYYADGVSRAAENFLLNIGRKLLEMDFSNARTLADTEKILSMEIEDERMLRFIQKSLGKKGDGSYGWKINLKSLMENFEHIMLGLEDDKYVHSPDQQRLPALFIKGSLSTYLRMDDLPLIQKIFPGAIFKIIPRSGHWVHSEQPETLLQAMNEFISA